KAAKKAVGVPRKCAHAAANQWNRLVSVRDWHFTCLSPQMTTLRRRGKLRAASEFQLGHTALKLHPGAPSFCCAAFMLAYRKDSASANDRYAHAAGCIRMVWRIDCTPASRQGRPTR